MPKVLSLLTGTEVEVPDDMEESAIVAAERAARRAMETLLETERRERVEAERKLAEMTADRDRLRGELETAVKARAEADTQAAAAKAETTTAKLEVGKIAASTAQPLEQRLKASGELVARLEERVKSVEGDLQATQGRFLAEQTARREAEKRVEKLAREVLNRPLPAPVVVEPQPPSGFEVSVVERDFNQDIKRLRITPKGA